MGNSLVGVAPPQILPVEHYLAEINGIQYDHSLGSTRFFKVARAKCEEGMLVVKVLVIPDPSLPLKDYQDKILEMKPLLSNIPNVLPYEKAMLTEKTGILIRQYVKDNLYDRISTRPFLTMEEKRWVAFQMLKALSDAHGRGVCHGDIKLENVLVTSWNWVLLADWAPFKPTYLPEDNPADYSFFFDTSRRRTCYIAPERFIKSIQSTDTVSPDPELLLTDTDVGKKNITPSMDIFSSGCALAELFMEGHPPFDFSQLLQYHSGEYSPEKVVQRIEDVAIRELVMHMMQREPSNRHSAEKYLKENEGKIFPNYFYTFLYPYIRNFCTQPILSADDKIVRLKQDLPLIIEKLNGSGEKQDQGNEKGAPKKNARGMEIIASVVTSCVRGLHHCTTKLQALDILRELSIHLRDDIILNRIVPYIFHLVHDSAPRVRAAAIASLTTCLTHVQSVPPNSAHIFPEYILPNLSHVVTDEAVIVRVAHAENIALLAETAMKFLEYTSLSGSEESDSNKQESTVYELEVKSLHGLIQQNLASILSDPENCVKQTLLKRGVTRLCVFFGRQKANDILLSHMITFLNDKRDKHLRIAFFDCIVGVASYVGWQSSAILKPLLIQGLSDPEEFVTVKAIDAMTSFTKLGLMKKHTLYELLRETVPFLLHYNAWIRHAVVALVCAAAQVLHQVDVQCKLAPLLQTFLSHPVIQLDSEAVILQALKPPIPKGVIDLLLRYSDLQHALMVLDHRHHLKTSWSLAIERGSSRHLDTSPQLRQLFQRLTNEGLTDEMEYYILAMKEHLLKLHRHTHAGASSEVDAGAGGKIDLGTLHKKVPTHVADLSVIDNMDTALQRRRGRAKEPEGTIRNEEWEHMFGTKTGASESPQSNKENQEKLLAPEITPLEDLPRSPNNQDKNGIDNTFIQYRCTPCKVELRELLSVRREQFRNRGGGNLADLAKPAPPPKWRPKCSLVAHLYEHRAAVSRVSWLSGTTLFATASHDGCVRIWDSGRMEGKSLANRSRQAYSRLGGRVLSLADCSDIKSLAAGSDNGVLHVFRIDSGNNKLQLLHTRQLDVEDEGSAIDLSYVSSSTMLCYATPHGSVQGWDLRQPGTAWRLPANPRQGLLTSFCVDSQYSWLVTGSSSGVLSCWDLRFQLPISQIIHPSGSRIRRVALHPSNPSWAVAAYHFNNEVSMWNMESQARELTLWASHAPPLSTTQVSSHATVAMQVGGGWESPFVVTGATDMRLRFWNLNQPEDSFLLSASATDTCKRDHFSYSYRVIDGYPVIIERQRKPSASASPIEDTPRKGPELPPDGHQDYITDIALCKASQWLVITSSADGVVKLWK